MLLYGQKCEGRKMERVLIRPGSEDRIENQMWIGDKRGSD
jgi:hypothetical protein